MNGANSSWDGSVTVSVWRRDNETCLLTLVAYAVLVLEVFGFSDCMTMLKIWGRGAVFQKMGSYRQHERSRGWAPVVTNCARMW